jgi:SAM-dependent methyltransferase
MARRATKLHLGCGSVTPKGWINLDGSWNARLAKFPFVRKVFKYLGILPASLLEIPWSPDILVHDVKNPLPFPNNSFCAIYSSNLLEHPYPQEAKRLLSDCIRVLRPGGVLRMVVPDLHAIVLEYLEGKSLSGSADEMGDMSKADRLNRQLHLRSPEPPQGNVFFKLYTVLKDLHSHKWMYDADSLIRFFQCAGFVDAYEMQFLHSRIEGIHEVKDVGCAHDEAMVRIEGVKP